MVFNPVRNNPDLEFRAVHAAIREVYGFSDEDMRRVLPDNSPIALRSAYRRAQDLDAANAKLLDDLVTMEATRPSQESVARMLGVREQARNYRSVCIAATAIGAIACAAILGLHEGYATGSVDSQTVAPAMIEPEGVARYLHFNDR